LVAAPAAPSDATIYGLAPSPVQTKLADLTRREARAAADAQRLRAKATTAASAGATHAEIAQLVAAVEQLTKQQELIREDLRDARDTLLRQLYVTVGELDAWRVAYARQNDDDQTRIFDQLDELRSADMPF
jgi:hypothetical protein